MQVNGTQQTNTQNAPKNNRAEEAASLESGKFEGELIYASQDQNLFSSENSQIDKAEMIQSQIQLKREKEDALREEDLSASAQMLFMQNFDNKQKFGAAQEITSHHQEAIQGKTDARKSHLRNPILSANEKNEAMKSENAKGMQDQEAVILDKKGSSLDNLRFDKELSQSTAAKKPLSGGELQNTAQNRMDGIKAFTAPMGQSAMAGALQNGAMGQQMSDNGSLGDQKPGKMAVAKSSATQESGSTSAANRKFDSMVQAKTSPVKGATSQVDIKEVVGNLKLMISNNKSEVVMKLKPEHLGKLEIKLIQQEDGMIGQLKVENVEAKDVLESQLPELRKALEEQGVQVKDFSILMNEDNSNSASFSFAEQQNSQESFQSPGSHGPTAQNTGNEQEVQSIPGGNNLSESGMSIYA